MKTEFYIYIIAIVILWSLIPWLVRRFQYNKCRILDDEAFLREFGDCSYPPETVLRSRERLAKLTGFRKERISPNMLLKDLVLGLDLSSVEFAKGDLSTEVDLKEWEGVPVKEFLDQTVRAYCLRWMSIHGSAASAAYPDQR